MLTKLTIAFISMFGVENLLFSFAGPSLLKLVKHESLFAETASFQGEPSVETGNLAFLLRFVPSRCHSLNPE